jgi:hypothetical protein
MVLSAKLGATVSLNYDRRVVRQRKSRYEVGTESISPSETLELEAQSPTRVIVPVDTVPLHVA